MKRIQISMPLLASAVMAASLTLTSGCNSSSEPSAEDFQAGLEESIKAAERGKELMKDAKKKPNGANR